MSDVTIAYFPVIGRGEQIRLICAMHGISVSELASTPLGEDFDKDKEAPFGTVPWMKDHANGLELNDKYSNGMRTVFGIHSAGYPNLFIMGGYQASFQFNLTFMLQTQGFHIADCIKYAREHGHDTIDAKPEVEDWWVSEVIRYRGTTNRNRECTPGYYNFEGEDNRREDGNYNGGMWQYCEHLKDVTGAYEKYFNFA